MSRCHAGLRLTARATAGYFQSLPGYDAAMHDASSDLALEVRHVAVVGGGLMGSGIAAVLVSSGYDVSLFDPDESARQRAARRVAKSAADPGAAARFSTAAELPAAVATADLVIEAVPEII